MPNEPQMDWTQAALNGGPPCFALLDDEGWYCGRAQRWEGHDGEHPFVSLEQMIVKRTVQSETARTLKTAIIATAMRGEIYEAALVETDEAAAWRIATKAIELITTSPRLSSFIDTTTPACDCVETLKKMRDQWLPQAHDNHNFKHWVNAIDHIIDILEHPPSETTACVRCGLFEGEHPAEWKHTYEPPAATGAQTCVRCSNSLDRYCALCQNSDTCCCCKLASEFPATATAAEREK